MAKRGDAAREAVKDTIIKAFNETGDFVAFLDKKIYVQAKDGPNGETLQFAITMTMPKVQVEAGAQTAGTPNQNGASAGVVINMPTKLSSEDKAQVEALKNKLRDMGVYKE